MQVKKNLSLHAYLTNKLTLLLILKLSLKQFDHLRAFTLWHSGLFTLTDVLKIN